jgi:hypothetical protein
MKNNRLELIILYIGVSCVILIVAVLARISAMRMGFDSFTGFMVFLVVIALLIMVYLSIHVFLQGLLLPIIGKLLSKIPFIRRRIDKREGIYDAEYVDSEVEDISNTEPVRCTGLHDKPVQLTLTENAESLEKQENEEKIKEVIEEPTVEKLEEPTVNTSPTQSLEDLRQEQLYKRALEQEERLNIALNYTRKTFVLYLSDKDLDILCKNVQIYIDKLDVVRFQPVKVRELTALDLRHFGWNIWNYFKPREQEEIACFLKTVFPDVFRDTEVKSIKRHLKDDELKGIIKIQEALSFV